MRALLVIEPVAAVFELPLTPRYTSSWTHDYAGSFPVVPLFIAGDIECMMDKRSFYKEQLPIVRLAVSTITNFDVPAELITNWGAALLSWIDHLENGGIRVEIQWISYSWPDSITREDDDVGGPPVVLKFMLKDADQPVEIDRLAFWIMHPAAQRRMQSAVKEQLDIERWYHWGYGWPEKREAELSVRRQMI
jgi:hypothetical protein